MRQETIVKDIYKFNELPENIQEKAISNLYDLNVDHDWWAFIYDEVNTLGFKITEFDIDRGSYCKIENSEDWHTIADNIIKIHGENCDTFQTATNFLKERDQLVTRYSDGVNTDIVTEENEYEFDQECDDLEDQFKKDLSEDYLTMLRNEYEYLTSEEAIKESIEANDYEFTIDGKIY